MQVDAVSRSASVARALAAALRAGLRPVPCMWPTRLACQLDSAADRLDAAARQPPGDAAAAHASLSSLGVPSRGLLAAVAAGADPRPLLAAMQRFTDAGEAIRHRDRTAIAYPAVVCGLAAAIAVAIGVVDRPLIAGVTASLTGRGLPVSPLTSSGRLILPLLAGAALVSVGWRLLTGSRFTARRQAGLAATVRAALEEAGCPAERQAEIVADLGGPGGSGDTALASESASACERAARWRALATLQGADTPARSPGRLPVQLEGTAAVLVAGVAVLLCGLALHGPLLAMIDSLSTIPAAPLWGTTP